MGMLDKINSSQKNQIGFFALLAFLCFFAGKKIFAYHDSRIAFLKRAISDIEQKRETVNVIRGVRARVQEFLPLGWDTKEMVEIMGRINNIAGKHGISIASFDPGVVSSVEGVYTLLKISLNLNSEYFNFVRFISEVEKLDMLVKIADLKLSSDAGGLNIRAVLSLEALAL